VADALPPVPYALQLRPWSDADALALDAAPFRDDGWAVRLLTTGLLSLAFCAQDAGEPPPVQKDPEVGESRHDISPPLRDIPPAEPQKGLRVHPVKPVPRPKPPPDAGQQE
jgi:hypothetical protein